MVYIFIGIWTRSAANSIRAIVDTEGSDIMHLMSAMENLNKLYKLKKWVFIIVLVLVLGAAVHAGEMDCWHELVW